MSTLPRTRRHHCLLRHAWVVAEAWVEQNRVALRQALAESMSPADRVAFDRHAVRIQARRGCAFLN
jgi:hypothetical protein